MVFLCAVQSVQIRSISPGQKWPGFSFALHLLRVQGFYFALLQYNHTQAFTARFAPSMQFYRQRYKTTRRALQRLFLRLCPLNRPRYQTETSGYNTACATLERITAAQRLQYIPDANAAPGRCTGQRSRSIIIMYIRAQQCAPVMDPCQTVQHIADHASPAGSAPAACGSLASATPGTPAEGSASPPVQGQPGEISNTSHARRRSPAAGARRGTTGGAAASLFGLSPDS